MSTEKTNELFQYGKKSITRFQKKNVLYDTIFVRNITQVNNLLAAKYE
jgi:hypothetical protein